MAALPIQPVYYIQRLLSLVSTSEDVQGEPVIDFDPERDAPVLRNLGPGSALHIVDVVYRRHGAADSEIPAADYTPEWTRKESWWGYDAAGKLSTLRGESRDLDGSLYRTASLENGEVVARNADGSERPGRRVAGLGDAETVEGLREGGD